MTSGGSPEQPAEAAARELQPVQRRAVRTLVASQVLGGVGVASGIAVGGLLAEDVGGSTSLAGLAQTSSVLGAALLAVPLARAAESSGRRVGLTAGYLLGLVGAALVIVAAVLSVLPLLLAGMLLFGGGTASGLQARYAATDAASAATRGRALSVVVWATTVGAVAGPNLSGVAGGVARSVGLPSLSGPFVFSAVAFAAAALVVTLVLRPDPLVAARGRRPASGAGRAAASGPGVAQTLAVVAALPRALLGLAAVALAHAVMVGVMVMTPVHLGHGGASLTVVGVVISVHVAGMYALSPVMGWLSDRFGRVATIAIGLAVLAAALVTGAVADAGQHRLVGVALTLLGIGWSACLVAGSTLLSESVPERVRTSVQGTSDLAMGLAAALAGALAGPVLAVAGYPALNAAAGLLLVPVVVLAVLARRTPPVAG